MKFDILAVASLLFFSAPSLAHPQPSEDLLVREDATAFELRDADFIAGAEELWKRKGGGGGGGKGGSGGGGGGKGGTSTGGTSSGGRTGSSSSGGKGSSTSSTGGSTRQGSGVQPSFGGGKYYGGGATQPYSAGKSSPRGITPFLLGGTALAFLPGIFLFGAFAYPYHNPYHFHNRSARANETSNSKARRSFWLRQASEGTDQTKPVTCFCAQYHECGCDDSDDTTFLDSLIGDGTYSKLNLSVVDVADINGTSTIILNGTLPNGTTIPGGTEDANAAAGVNGLLMQSSGYLVMVALAACTVLLV